MNTGLKLSSVVLADLLAISGCTSMTGQTAGQYVDDTTITASVKAKLVGDKTATYTNDNDIPYEGHDLSFGMLFSAIRRKGVET